MGDAADGMTWKVRTSENGQFEGWPIGPSLETSIDEQLESSG